MAEPNRWLFDASATRRLVLAHRGAGAPAVRCVVVPLPPDLPGAARIDLAAGRLTRLLREPDPVPLRTVAAEVDALGKAAVGRARRADEPRGQPVTARRRSLGVGLAKSLVLVVLLTLVPEGAGWAWGSPVTELHWYATSPDSPTARLQLVGNLGLLTAPAALAVALWPALGRPPRLMAVALASGTVIELLQWALPLGRVVSPLDALLNATGAVVGGLVVSRFARGAVRMA